jgi:hypothetical protein
MQIYVASDWTIEGLLDAVISESATDAATDGAFTVAELALKLGHDEKWVRTRLAALKQAGKVEVIRVRRYRLDDQPYSAPAYRLIHEN